ncbi:hypothetical protein [Comamonas terrigena]|uniref:hypothetical protein n=1 Tax=Comamonas terrigena TaxID=32013 RepID=UPI002897DD78|nr:hypothetical protein [Comamonas terrigena]
MSEVWAERQRRTNQLVRGIARKVLEGPIDGNRLYGLCRLTWITEAYDAEHPAYIRSTKIPALGDALHQNFTGRTLDEVANEVATQLERPELETLVRSHTGFTNFYKAYRNSAREWMLMHEAEITAIFQRAYLLQSDADAQLLGADIAALPSIPKANHPHLLMRPEYLLTPACFALDPRLRFPILNGAERVQSVLRRIGAADRSVPAQIQLFVGLIGQNGVRDAADLDQLGLTALDGLGRADHEPMRQLLMHVPDEGDSLPLKDEEDVRRLQQALDVAQRRVHNSMTNKLRQLLANWTLLEGRAKDCRYDVLVKGYDGGDNDLLLEVKSSVDSAQIRMAIGQVYDYWHRLMGPSSDCHAAIVLPGRPDTATEELLQWLEVGLLWLEGGQLYTSTEWLEEFVAAVGPKK